MKVAIMQPYFFPYIGYFQLVNSVDKFVFYDDVNFIKRGWINRNRILLNDKEALITIPLFKASQNKYINEISLFFNKQAKDKLILKIENSYKKAPNYDEVINLIKKIISADISNISEYSANSVISVSNYLGINTNFFFSSLQSPESKGMGKADRLIHICKKLEADHYINSYGGRDLYTKSYFKSNQIDLSFIKTIDLEYKQFKNAFIPGLSIIDVLMFNSKLQIQKMLTNHLLV